MLIVLASFVCISSFNLPIKESTKACQVLGPISSIESSEKTDSQELSENMSDLMDLPELFKEELKSLGGQIIDI